jgi:hypothetical protein
VAPRIGFVGRVARARGRAGRNGQGGQATVELALALPVVVLALLLVLQVGLVVGAHVRVIHAARDGARAAAVHRSADAARSAVTGTGGLGPSRTDVVVRFDDPRRGLVAVEVRHRVATDVPLVGHLVGEPTVTARTTMAIEAPSGGHGPPGGGG